VAAAKPGRAGEVLSLLASGLGPTRPALEPGGLFKSSPLSIVNSPVEVVVNGTSAEVLYAGGYPGTDTCQVNFRPPSAVAQGNAALLISSAWIPSREVRIAVQ